MVIAVRPTVEIINRHQNQHKNGVQGESSMRLWHVGIVGGIVGLALSGCEDPGEIVPLAPPGESIPRVSPDADAAQAQGEMAAPALKTASEPAKPVEYTPATPTAKGQTKTTPHGLKYETLQEGTGPELKPGQTAQVHYVGKLENGTVFDSSRSSGQPRRFVIGSGKMIAGWEEGMPGMRVGEIRKMTVPPALGYGERGQPPNIPANATLIFEVELINVF
jgi:FKBP-type peptidyl-prolyl cis-trans isomerase